MSKDRGLFFKRGKWWIDYYFQGRRIRECVGPSKTLAREVRAKRLAQIAEQRFFPERVRRRITVAEWIDQQLEATEKTHRAQRHRRIHGAFWKRKLGKMRLDAVRPEDITAAIAEIRATRAPATGNRYLAFLKRVFTTAQESGLVDSNPVRGVEFAREPAGRILWLDDEREERVMEHLEPRDRALVQLAMNTGMRQGEQWRLRWPDVALWRSLFLADTKNGTSRWVPLNEAAKVALRWLEAHRDPHSDRVCPGSAYQAAHRFKIACKKAELDGYTWHVLRHTFASRLMLVGVPPKTVQELMGHKTIQQTMRYSHLAPSYLHEAVAKISGPEQTPFGHHGAHNERGQVLCLNQARKRTVEDSTT